MIRLNEYLNDGANWQAQAVLSYLKGHYEDIVIHGTYDRKFHEYDAIINVGRYENEIDTREQGYTFSLRYKSGQRNYVVYEHRNSDKICVVQFDERRLSAPSGECVMYLMNGDKYNYTISFGCGEIKECGEWIKKDMRHFIKTIDEIQNKEE